jgi:hypothetical protein
MDELQGSTNRIGRVLQLFLAGEKPVFFSCLGIEKNILFLSIMASILLALMLEHIQQVDFLNYQDAIIYQGNYYVNICIYCCFLHCLYFCRLPYVQP